MSRWNVKKGGVGSIHLPAQTANIQNDSKLYQHRPENFRCHKEQPYMQSSVSLMLNIPVGICIQGTILQLLRQEISHDQHLTLFLFKSLN
jgi:hypothetical protein